MRFGSLFAGIGGFDLGLERAGMECVWQVEIDPFCRKVLEKHWPNVRRYEDVRTVGKHNLEPVDLICGGFPCQDISNVGERAGIAGERSGLWSEFYRIIRELRPSIVIIENSIALLIRGLHRVLCDLAACGFDAEWQPVLASDFTLPHRRERLFIVAYANRQHGKEGMGSESFGTKEVFPRSARERMAVRVQAADRFVGMDDGVSGTAYRLRGHALGNAVVPQVAEWIGERIMKAELMNEVSDDE